jgi:hypothetical protein
VEAGRVQVHKKNGTAAQKWKLVYVDKAEKIKTEGVHDSIGIEMGKPFLIRSRMWMNRVIEWDGGSNLNIRDLAPNGIEPKQFFVVDPVSQTIEPLSNKQKALAIQSNGNGSRVIIENANSRWW